MNRKEWLEQQIVELENGEMFDELSETGKLFLDSYKTELKLIKEQGGEA